LTAATEAEVADDNLLMNVERTRTILASEQLDGVIASSLENYFYFSGIWNFGFEMFPHTAEAYVVARSDEPTRGTIVSSVGEADLTLDAYESISGVRTFGSFFRAAPTGAQLDSREAHVQAITQNGSAAASALDALVAAINDQGLTMSAIGVDERCGNRTLLQQLQARLPYAKITPAADILRRIRMVKTPLEQARLIRTLRITEAAMDATVAAARPGITERELKQVFETGIVAAGARPAFSFIRFGRAMAIGQTPPADTPLAARDYIWFDVGCTYEGYRSDIGRIIAIGEPSPRLRALYTASKQGQERALELMTPGTPACDVFEAAVQRVREAGIPHYERHHVGHGIGIEFYDAPVLAAGVDTQLEEGMVFEVETPYYELSFGGTFIEDTVVIRRDGPEILTRIERELRVIDS
jgi:Xaa-Pro aminopeptidase